MPYTWISLKLIKESYFTSKLSTLLTYCTLGLQSSFLYYKRLISVCFYLVYHIHLYTDTPLLNPHQTPPGVSDEWWLHLEFWVVLCMPLDFLKIRGEKVRREKHAILLSEQNKLTFTDRHRDPFSIFTQSWILLVFGYISFVTCYFKCLSVSINNTWALDVLCIGNCWWNAGCFVWERKKLYELKKKHISDKS